MNLKPQVILFSGFLYFYIALFLKQKQKLKKKTQILPEIDFHN